MFRIAIIYSDNKIYVEFDPEKFMSLLILYFNKFNSIPAAINKIIEDIKNESLTK